MKESTLLEMQNKIKAITNVLQQLINENTQLRDLAVGTLETLKLMPGYEKAIESYKKALEIHPSMQSPNITKPRTTAICRACGGDPPKFDQLEDVPSVHFCT